MYRFEKLDVWQKSTDFCGQIYKTTESFPKEELFGLTSQLRRAATSIIVTILKLAFKLGYLSKCEGALLQNKLAEIGRLLQGLINSKREKIKNQHLKSKN